MCPRAGEREVSSDEAVGLALQRSVMVFFFFFFSSFLFNSSLSFAYYPFENWKSSVVL